jgi:hypothetical protein
MKAPIIWSRVMIVKASKRTAHLKHQVLYILLIPGAAIVVQDEIYNARVKTRFHRRNGVLRHSEHGALESNTTVTSKTARNLIVGRVKTHLRQLSSVWKRVSTIASLHRSQTSSMHFTCGGKIATEHRE